MSELEQGRIGSSLDDFLDEEGIRGEVETRALKGVPAWQIEQWMRDAGLIKTAMSRRMSISRAQLDRLLDPTKTSETFFTLQKTAAVVGRHVRLQLN